MLLRAYTLRGFKRWKCEECNPHAALRPLLSFTHLIHLCREGKRGRLREAGLNFEIY